MRHKGRLLAAVTASGVMLCLSVSTEAAKTIKGNTFLDRDTSLSLKVDGLKQKLRVLDEDFNNDTPDQKIRNIVQFFNFFNCFRPGWRNC